MLCIEHISVSLQVCLYFFNELYRGNRVTKVDAGSFNAFSSPNLGPLATAEVDITSKPVVLQVCHFPSDVQKSLI